MWLHMAETVHSQTMSEGGAVPSSSFRMSSRHCGYQVAAMVALAHLSGGEGPLSTATQERHAK